MTVRRQYPTAEFDSTLPIVIPGVGVTSPAYAWLSQSLAGNEGDAIVSWTNAIGASSAPLQAATAGARPSIHIENSLRMARFDGVDDEIAPNANQQGSPVTANNPLSMATNTTAQRRTVSVVARVVKAAGSQCGIFNMSGGYVERSAANNSVSLMIGTPSNIQPSVAGNQTGAFKVYSFAVDTVSGSPKAKLAVNATETEVDGTGSRNIGALAIGRSGTGIFGQIDVLGAVYWDKYLTNAELIAEYAALKLAFPGLLL